MTSGGTTTTFVSNGDGQLVAKKVDGTVVAHYAAGGLFEQDPSTGAAKKYYRFGGRLVAVREVPAGGAGMLHYLHHDHLGSTSLQTSATGAYEGHAFRGPFGQPWVAGGALATDLQYTGQRSLESSLGSLYHYQARWYSPVLGRFLQPDTIVPDPANPQSLNRYAYAANNPIRYTDPDGHCAPACAAVAAAGGPVGWAAAGLGAALVVSYTHGWGPQAAENRAALFAPVVGAVNFAGKVGGSIRAALGGEAGTPGGTDPEDPFSEWADQARRNSATGYEWEGQVRNHVGGTKMTLRTLIRGKYKNVDLDAFVQKDGINYEAKAIDWEAKTYQSESALRGRLGDFARQLAEQGEALQQHGLGDKLVIWFRNLPSQGASMTIEEIEAFLMREVPGLVVKWGGL